MDLKRKREKKENVMNKFKLFDIYNLKYYFNILFSEEKTFFFTILR